jgi:LysR family glycine cleavage system transcriptional activator
MRETMFPVASPRLLEGPAPLKTVADLCHHTLISDYDWRVDFWQLWLEAAGMTRFVAKHTLSFNYSNLMLQAAIDGLGVALSQNALAGDDLAAGRLVRLFDYTLPTDFAFYVVVPEGTAQRPKIAAFRNWLLEEACGKDPQAPVVGPSVA